MLVKFQGESNYDSVVNHNGLDIEEEENFEHHLRGISVSVDDFNRMSLEECNAIYERFCHDRR